MPLLAQGTKSNYNSMNSFLLNFADFEDKSSEEGY
jgi:hypothetical protein